MFTKLEEGSALNFNFLGQWHFQKQFCNTHEKCIAIHMLCSHCVDRCSQGVKSYVSSTEASEISCSHLTFSFLNVIIWFLAGRSVI